MNSKKKILIALGSFGVSIALFWGIVVYPVFRGVLGDYQRVLALKKELLQLQEDRQNSREFETLSLQDAQEFARIENLFVDNDTPIAFFRFLDQTANSFGLQIEKAPSPTQRVQGDRWPSFDIRITGRGSYPHFMAFLQKIENAPYLLEIKTLTLTTREKGSSQEKEGLIEFSMSIKVFTK